MDTIDPLRFLFSFLFVLGLIGTMGIILKRYGHRIPGQKLFAMKEEGGRLQVVEVKWIDHKHKLVLIRRDHKEHLLLISDKGELVIENAIEGQTNG